MEEISLTRWKPVVGGKWLYSCVHKDKGSPLSVYESGPVDALVEAAREMKNSRCTGMDIVGHDPKTGHPLNREGMAALRLEEALAPFEQSGNTGELEEKP